jgi:hypothetical protein
MLLVKRLHGGWPTQAAFAWTGFEELKVEKPEAKPTAVLYVD